MKHRRRKILYVILFIIILLTANSNTLFNSKILNNHQDFYSKQQNIEIQINKQISILDSINNSIKAE